MSTRWPCDLRTPQEGLVRLRGIPEADRQVVVPGAPDARPLVEAGGGDLPAYIPHFSDVFCKPKACSPGKLSGDLRFLAAYQDAKGKAPHLGLGQAVCGELTRHVQTMDAMPVPRGLGVNDGESTGPVRVKLGHEIDHRD